MAFIATNKCDINTFCPVFLKRGLRINGFEVQNRDCKMKITGRFLR
jgi:hypothetical protein